MPSAIDATVGGAAANSYELLAEATTYFDDRLPLDPPWSEDDSGIRALLMATRGLEQFATPARLLIPESNGIAPYYRVARQWTGQPATTTQRLSWPRIGMYDRNGNEIPSNVIPIELKWAESEFAGQLRKADRTLDNDVIVQGLTSVKAGSVALTFKNQIFAQPIPDAVIGLLVPGWLTDEIIESVNQAEFDMISTRGCR